MWTKSVYGLIYWFGELHVERQSRSEDHFFLHIHKITIYSVIAILPVFAYVCVFVCFWMTLTTLVTLTFDLRSRDQDEVKSQCYIYHLPQYVLNPSSGLGCDR